MAEARSTIAPAPAVPLRKRISRRLRHVVRRAMSVGEYRRVAALKDRYKGRRCFLLANGPSLAQLDLSHLADEEVCVVNMGIKALDAGLPRATMHMITDNNRYRRFAQDCEDYAAKYGIGMRFFPYACRKIWPALPRRAGRPFYLLSNPARFVDRGMVSDPRDGYSGGSTVLLSALQLLFYLGFDEVFVAGCDLDYQSGGTYFYQLDSKDQTHEADPAVIARRQEMGRANGEFTIARRFYEQHGRRLANAGAGGNLHALERVDFESLFASRR